MKDLGCVNLSCFRYHSWRKAENRRNQISFVGPQMHIYWKVRKERRCVQVIAKTRQANSTNARLSDAAPPNPPNLAIMFAWTFSRPSVHLSRAAYRLFSSVRLSIESEDSFNQLDVTGAHLESNSKRAST